MSSSRRLSFDLTAAFTTAPALAASCKFELHHESR